MTNMTSIAITGANGRMGRRLIALARESAVFTIVAAIERPEHPILERDAGEIAGVGKIGVPITPELAPTPQVLVDFTSPPSMRHWLKTCRDRGNAMIIGTTGLQKQDHDVIDETATQIPVLQAPNMSLGVNLLFKIAGEVAKRLGDDYDIEIVEGHHRFKKDAPSGTAMGIAESILKATGKTKDVLVYDRHGDDMGRKRGEIGMHAMRIGDEVGRHTAFFAALGERLELTHVATNRDTFVHGAASRRNGSRNKNPVDTPSRICWI